MKLRNLENKDAAFMLEWMHDTSVVKYMRSDFINKTKNDCLEFIKNSNQSNIDIHKEIVDNNDEYLGSVSLKNICNKSAEFAIIIRKKTMGKGVASFAMKEIISFGFQILKLEYIYWCVNYKNIRAIKFYDKLGYKKVLFDTNLKSRVIGGGTAQKRLITLFGIKFLKKNFTLCLLYNFLHNLLLTIR